LASVNATAAMAAQDEAGDQMDEVMVTLKLPRSIAARLDHEAVSRKHQGQKGGKSPIVAEALDEFFRRRSRAEGGDR